MTLNGVENAVFSATHTVPEQRRPRLTSQKPILDNEPLPVSCFHDDSFGSRDGGNRNWRSSSAGSRALCPDSPTTRLMFSVNLKHLLSLGLDKSKHNDIKRYTSKVPLPSDLHDGFLR